MSARYNRTVNSRAPFLAAFAAVLLLAGCSKNIDTPDDIKAGVIKDLSKKMDVKSMDITVQSVAFRGKEADASVIFSPKGLPAGSGMMMKYVMARDGDEWKIKSRALDGDAAHMQQQSGGSLPSGHPGMGAGAPGGTAGGTALPPGHPATSGGAATTTGPGGVPMPAVPAQKQ